MADEQLITELIGDASDLEAVINDAVSGIEGFGGILSSLDGTQATANVGVSGVADAKADIDSMDSELEEFLGNVEEAGDEGVDAIDKLEDEFEDLNDEIEKSGKKAGGLMDIIAGSFAGTGGLGGMLGGMLGSGFGPIGTIAGAMGGKLLSGIFDGISSGIDLGMEYAGQAFEAFAVQEAAETNLASVLEATGNAAGFTADQLKELASAQQQFTLFGDEMSLEAMAIQATFKNIRGENFVKATMAAKDMATVLGGDLKQSTMQLSKALNDPIKGVNALARSGVSFSEDQKEMIKTLVESGKVMEAQNMILEELEGEFGGAAAAAADTFGGKMVQLQNRVGDVWEVIGEGLTPALDAMGPIIDYVAVAMENLAPRIKDVTSWLVEQGEALVDQWMPTMKAAVDTSLMVWTSIEWYVMNFSTIMETEVMKWELWVTGWVEDLKHLFGTVVPDLLMWFGRNWQDIFADIANFNIKVHENMFKNISNFFSSVWDLLQGKDTEWKWTALTDGFESTLKELPEIAERNKTAIEESLEGAIAQNEEDLGNDLMARIQKNQEFLSDVFTKSVSDAESALEHTASDIYEGFGVEEEKAKDKKEKDETISSSIDALEALKDRMDQSSFTVDEQENPAMALKKAVKDAKKEPQKIEGGPEIIKFSKDTAVGMAQAGATLEEMLKALPKVGALQ